MCESNPLHCDCHEWAPPHLGKDVYGRTWPYPKKELCPTCKQPDNTGDCSHEPLSNADALQILFGGANGLPPNHSNM